MQRDDDAGQDVTRSAGAALWVWIRAAWARLGWRHVLLAILLEFLIVALAPGGGAWLHVGRRGPDDPFLELISGPWGWQVLPTIFAAMVADEASDAGVAPFITYGGALAACAALLPVVDAGFASLVGLSTSVGGFSWFLFIQLFLTGGFFMAAWAYWHVSSRDLVLTQTAEAERVRDQQQLFNARLLTLQARVEPQLLFDTLSRVRATHLLDNRSADTLLADMITLLRAMLPTANRPTSTVEREFGLAAAWLRVQRPLGRGADVRFGSPDETRGAEIGPMLVLPMLRTVIDGAAAQSGSWHLDAAVAPDPDPELPHRLRIALSPRLDLPGPPASVNSADLSPLRERVSQLYGNEGAIDWVASADRTALVLDVPLTATGFP